MQGLHLQCGQSRLTVAQTANCSITFYYAAGEKCFLPNLYLYIVYSVTVKLVHNAFKIFIVPTFS